MPDIAMCANKECESRVHCYRYRAIPNEFRQSYFVIEGPMIKCEEYWSTSGRDDDELVPMAELETPGANEGEKT